MRDRCASNDDEVSPVLKAACRIVMRYNLAGKTKSHTIPIKVGEIGHKRMSLIFWVHRTLEYVPQRNIEIVDLAFVDQLLGQFAGFPDILSETLRRDTNADLKFLAAAVADSIDNLEEEPAPFGGRAAIFILASVI